MVLTEIILKERMYFYEIWIHILLQQNWYIISSKTTGLEYNIYWKHINI
jgi:hypothetical protein